jgi:hypothetical protein
LKATDRPDAEFRASDKQKKGRPAFFLFALATTALTVWYV